MASNQGGMRRPQQQRSRRTAQSIVEAAEKLLATRSFQELTLAELVEEAGCTVGAFYHLFPDKQSLLRHLEDRFYERANRIFDGLEGAGTADPVTFLEMAALRVTELYIESRASLRALVLAAASDPELAKRMDAGSRAIGERIADAIVPGLPVAHTEPREATLFALGVVRAFLREAVLFGDGRVLGDPYPAEVLAARATRLTRAYLEWSP